MDVRTITVKGAREHNLRNVSLKLPAGKLICFTGVSGSGKSSFAFDTLYAEGQRRYIESLSAYARQFLGQLAKPDVDLITGLSPSISIQQSGGGWNPRSTVGTVTQIHDYLRVLYARVGRQHCSQCDQPITAQTREQIVGRILTLPAGCPVVILSPVIRGQKGEYRDLFEDMLKRGFARARVDGEIVRLADDLRLGRNMRHDIEIVIDRLTLDAQAKSRLAEAVDAALALGEGSLIVQHADAGDVLLSSRYACTRCNLSFEPPSPQMFSFNSPTGMCQACDGLGTRFDFDPDLLVPNPRKSFLGLAIEPMRTRIGRWRKHIYQGVADAIGFDLKTPWKDLPLRAKNALLFGTGDTHITFTWRMRRGSWKHGGTFEGVIAELRAKYRKAGSSFVRAYYEKYMRRRECPDCHGAKLSRQARSVRIGGRTLPELTQLTIGEAVELIDALELGDTERYIAEEVLKEIRSRLRFLTDVGLHYLTLDRGAPTLSGGESQRIRLASQIGAGLVGVLYILDEPSIGLHARDNARLLESLKRLRDLGNTVIVVEHDEDTMRAADVLVDFGPGPGVRGGEIVASGTFSQVARSRKSLTGKYLTGKKKIEVPVQRRLVSAEPPNRKKATGRKNVKKKRAVRGEQLNDATANRTNGEVPWLTVKGASHNNLKEIDVNIPLGRFVCVTGVSGSGKSSLVNDILFQRLARDLNGAEKVHPGKHADILGLDDLDKVIDIDQTPIGRTPRSNPATYIKVFDEIRKLYARTPDAKVRGYKPGRFSFNVPTGAKGGGRCEACEGNGANKMEMDFLADVWMSCPVCGSHRFNRETLQIRFKGKSIADVLEMDVQEALKHFSNIPKVAAMLQTLHDVGLDYMKLGQSSTTLSGGEAQRIKLARELVKRSTGRTLYLLDEPTTGLHFEDIRRLLDVLHGFVDAGNTVVVIEHNTDVIKTADWVIDLGPDGGAGGGTIVAQGTPEQVAKVRKSYTGQILHQLLIGKSSSGTAAGVKKPRGAIRAKGGGALKNIKVVGAAQHNLKDITVQVPRERTTICSGLSGSGKSSFAIDTVYAEGQRRYVESLSAYARQFLGQLQKPRVEHVEGLSPAISIEQKAPSRSPRSTVGTVTEVYDYMRVLWARLGTPHCPKCSEPIGTQTADEIIEKIMELGEGTRALILAPIHRTGSESYAALFEREKQNGFLRVRVDGTVYELDGEVPVDHRRRHDIELVVDRILIRKRSQARISDSVEQALAAGEGVMILEVLGDEKRATHKKDTDLRFSQLFSCDRCGTSYDELSPHHLSFNTRLGWCQACEGLGVQRGASPAAIVTHPTRSIVEGAIGAWGKLKATSLLGRLVRAVADRIGFDISTPWNALAESQRLAFLQGGEEAWIEIPGKPKGLRVKWRGFFPAIDRATRTSWQYRKRLEDLVTDVPCEACRGTRLRPEAREMRLASQSIADVCSISLVDALCFFKELKLDARQKRVAGELLKEVVNRLTFLVDVGLDYLTLGRSAPTLSGGESQRIRLASQIGSGLTGVLYVLDEPTIGLHPRDNARLIAALKKLRNLGNTLLIVEHDRDVIASADHVLDFGPGAGNFGGHVTAAASPAALKRKRASLTGKFLAGKESISVPADRRPVVESDDAKRTPDRWLTVHGAYHNNLKEIDVAFPLGRLVCVTGVSGSGKSSLVSEVLYKALAARIHRARLVAGGHQRISGVELVDKIINVDQSPIGASPTSNPATYTGVFDLVRELFAKLPDAKVRGYTANRFSFNRPGGRCEACEGNGQRCIEMHFLPDVWITCEGCGGRRYTGETLEVRYKGKSIADVLEMRISEALQLFAGIPKLRRMLQTLDDVGLGYLQLGQAAPTLSGGEAQRVKLAAELGRPATGKTLYILDEPTTGLHFEDLRKLLSVLHRLVDLGNTVVCIEHNLDVIKSADWVIELGPEAGDRGGELVAACTPEKLVRSKRIHTGAALKPILEAGPREKRVRFDSVKQAELESELEGPLKLEGPDAARMPWEVDGRKWHLEQRPDRNGQPIHWDANLLDWVIATVEKINGFEPTDWKNPSRVEVKAPGSKTPWFLHALTRGGTLLDISLRVPSRTFDAKDLIKTLGLVPLDARDDLPFYGESQRVKVRRVDKTWDNVRVLLHDAKDLSKTVFRAYLRKAANAYFDLISGAAEGVTDAEPWKNDGKAWHVGQGSLKKRNKRAKWKPTLLLETIGSLTKFRPETRIDWANNVGVKLHIDGKQVGLLVTNMPDGLRFQIRVPRHSVTPTQIDRLGRDPAIQPGARYDVVRFWVTSRESCDRTQFRSLLDHTAAYRASLREEGK